MTPEIRSMYASGVSSLADFAPSDPEDFVLDLFVDLRRPDGGSEAFDLRVCSPRWLTRYLADREIMSGRHWIVMSRYDRESLVSFVRSAVACISAESWPEVIEKMARIAHRSDEYPDERGHHMS